MVDGEEIETRFFPQVSHPILTLGLWLNVGLFLGNVERYCCDEISHARIHIEDFKEIYVTNKVIVSRNLTMKTKPTQINIVSEQEVYEEFLKTHQNPRILKDEGKSEEDCQYLSLFSLMDVVHANYPWYYNQGVPNDVY